MASIKDLITDAKVNELLCVVESGSGKFVCFTRLLDESWVIGTTDGCDLWRTEMDIDDLDAQRDLVDVSSIDAYLSRIRSAFTNTDVQVVQTGSTNMTLILGQGSKAMKLKLYEGKAMESKTEMQCLILRLAESVTGLDTKLEKANKTIDGLKQQKLGSSAVGGGLFDLDVKKKKVQPKAPPKHAGMSVINPGSKKRKQEKGVDFD